MPLDITLLPLRDGEYIVCDFCEQRKPCLMESETNYEVCLDCVTAAFKQHELTKDQSNT